MSTYLSAVNCQLKSTGERTKPEWLTKDNRRQLRRKARAWKLFKQTGLEAHKLRYKLLRNSCGMMVRTAKRRFGEPISVVLSQRCDMISKFDNSDQKNMDEIDSMGKIIISNVRMRFVTEDSLRTWLEKYGTIEEVKIFSSCALVKFSSDFEAAGAVQCEDGIRRYGAVVSVKHAEPNFLRTLERGPTTRPSELDDGQSLSSSVTETGDQLRQRRRFPPQYEDVAPRSYKRPSSSSKSPPRRSNRSGVRDTHPLTWLSEAADQSSQKVTSSERVGLEPSANSKSSRPYDVAILAINHDLVPYAEAVQERISGLLDSSITNYRAPTSHIMVLVNIDHLTPCIQDLTNDGVLFAIIVNASNWTHSSCTLRILHSPTQQEHRNMPLVDAIGLLSKDYSNYLNSKNLHQTTVIAIPSSQPSQNATETAKKEKVEELTAEPDDPDFLKPSRHIVSLLRMLGDSRVLSVGELDELAVFIADRKSRLTKQFSGTNPDGNASNAALKSKILDMLYPNLKPQSAADAGALGTNAINQSGSLFSTPTDQSSRELASKLKSPSVQQALDNLIKSSQRVQPTCPPQAYPQISGGAPTGNASFVQGQNAGQQSWQSWNNQTPGGPPNNWSNYNRDGNTGYKQSNEYATNSNYYQTPAVSMNQQQSIATQPKYDDTFNKDSRQSRPSRGTFQRYRGTTFNDSNPGKSQNISRGEKRTDIHGPSTYIERKYPKRGGSSTAGPSSRFVLPDQVASNKTYGSGERTGRSPMRPLSTQKPPSLMSLNPSMQASQYYGGQTGSSPPPFSLPNESAQLQKKDWSAYGSSYENY